MTMYSSSYRRAAAAIILALGLAGCATTAQQSSSAPELTAVTPSQRDLIYMPPPATPVPVAVYSFLDQTGQLKPSDTIQSLSRAVSQGGTSMMIKALQDAGNGHWFTVVERERLDNLLKERQIIQEMRQRYLGERVTPPEVLPSLLFAGVLLEGGVIGYDSNVQTGGLGAAYLAIGASTEYRKSTVTVYLRAVSVKTGEILANVTTSKTIASVGLKTNVFKYVTFDELAEFETGVTTNEPNTVALQQAIEKAVSSLILEGAQKGLWSFYDKDAGKAWLDDYAQQKARAFQQVRTFPGGKAPPPAKSSVPPPAQSANKGPAMAANDNRARSVR